jgi:shikimate kinase
MARIVVLVGMMGSGKTTVGKRLASRLGCRFVDTDDLVVAAAEKPVRAIFEHDGEPEFRRLESAALVQALSSGDDLVVAAAGGAVLSEANRAAMREHAACVVWLDADVATLGQRTARGAHRPLIDDDPQAKLATLDRERRALYESVADARVDTAGIGVNDVVASVEILLERKFTS